MKKTLPLFFLIAHLLLFSYCYAQTPDWVWARSATNDPNGTGEGFSIANDGFNNVYITGDFDDTISFGPYSLYSPGYNSFLAKYDSDGNINWVRTNTCQSNNGLCVPYSVCTDKNGNIFITGYFRDTIFFDTFTLTSAGGEDVFLVKYDSTGRVLWAKSAGDTLDDIGYGVAADVSGNVYMTGAFASPNIAFGSTILTTGGWYDVFLAKYDSSGNVLWAKSAGAANDDEGMSVAADAFGKVYITGTFSSTSVSFGSNTLTHAGGYDIFIAQYDSSGNALWAKGIGGNLNEQGLCVTTDLSKNIYITGWYYSSSLSLGAHTITNAGGCDGFIAKYDSSGHALWAKDIGGSGVETGFSVACDKYGKPSVSGSIGSVSITFDTITLQLPSVSYDPMFLAAFDSSGHGLWGKVLVSGGDDNNAVAVDSSGCIYIGGDFYQVSPFVIGSDSLYCQGTENVFIGKLCNVTIMASFTSSDTSFCSEPPKCIHFYDHSIGNPTSWQWSFPGGTPSVSTFQNPDSICYFTPGTYPVTLIVTNSAGSDTFTVSPMIVVGATPPNPTVTVVGADTLFSSHGLSYQWFLDGNVIAGATDSSWVANQTGTYSVRITGVGGCSSLSAGTYIDITSILQVGNWQLAVGISPNPSHGKFSVVFNHPCSHALIKVFNVFGEEIYEEKMQDGLMKKDIQLDIAPGVYFLVVAGDKNRVVKKVVVE